LTIDTPQQEILQGTPNKRRNPWFRFAKSLSKRMPKGLYARSLIIIIAPMVVLQSVIAFVFMERHWQLVTQRLSQAVTGDIAAIVQVIESYPQDPEFAQITNLARDQLDLNIAILPPDPFPPAVGKPFFSLLDDTLRSEITKQINRPFWIDTVGDSDILEIRVRLESPEENVLRIFVRRNRAYASNSHIFLMWMFGTSLVLLIISILFIRNQIRPIQHLSAAAENFGKGQAAPESFKVRGAQEVRQASLAFIKMRQRIERQMEQRTAMLTGVSHDLRTILTRFKLQLALIRQTPEIEELQADVDDMQSMLQEYIEFARGETDESIEDVKVLDVLLRQKAEATLRDKQYTVDCDETLTIKIRPDAFTRLVGNIIANAFRYANEVKVNVTTGQTRLHITVDDDGPGIPEDRREDVFKPFFRLDDARNLDETGTGLGLSIARDIVRNHGGDINLYDSPLGGLRVIITLPI
jgi:two-component system osmolarity sensor histidine kinase EnvZ